MTHTADTDQITYYADRIRTAYAQLVARGEWVMLSDLRDQVGGYRHLVDAALRAMERQPDVNIVPESNQKALSDWDRQCAVWIGGQHRHAIAIGI